MRAGASRGRVLAICLSMALALGCSENTGDSPAFPSQGAGGPGPAEAELEAEAAPGGAEIFSVDAKHDTVAVMREDLQLERHPSDGDGRAWLVEPTESVPARSRQRVQIEFEVGPLGIAEGGMVFLQTSPFWGWDEPQTEHEQAPGYTIAKTSADGVELLPASLTNRLVSFEIKGRALVEGERITITAGAGEAGLRVDSYAERRSPVWIAVDGDGDGVRRLLDDPPHLDIIAGSPVSILILTLTSTARPGQPVRLTAALLDRMGSAGLPFEGELELAVPDGLELPDRLVFEARHGGRRSVEGVAARAGVYRVTATVRLPKPEIEDPLARPLPDRLEAASNPLVVRPDIETVLWADLHGHSQLSDGTGTTDDYFVYAREVADLDVVALTDHDHWGMKFIDANPEMWDEIRASTQRHHVPNRFVTILGYEWTSWLHGHRHVLYFDETRAEVLSSMDPQYETPAQLWEALAGRDALTFAHHSAGGPISTNWRYYPPPELEPVTEVMSTHGSSEAWDSPLRIYRPVAGNFVRNALDHGYRFGFIGSGDGHDGHPGLVYVATRSPQGGLAAIRATEHTRKGVLDALRARRVYATSGARIWMRFQLDGHSMGRTIASSSEAEQRLDFEIVAQDEIEVVELVRGGLEPGEVVERIEGDGRDALRIERRIPRLEPGEYLYGRIVQKDGHLGWTSPIYVVADEGP